MFKNIPLSSVLQTDRQVELELNDDYSLVAGKLFIKSSAAQRQLTLLQREREREREKPFRRTEKHGLWIRKGLCRP